jgi:hypothetical protein
MTEWNERACYHTDMEVPQQCWRGHRWTAPMYSEYGGWFYFEDDDAQCPECDAWHDMPPPGAPGRFLRGRTLRDAMAVEHTINQDRPGYGFGRLLTYRQAVARKRVR